MSDFAPLSSTSGPRGDRFDPSADRAVSRGSSRARDPNKANDPESGNSAPDASGAVPSRAPERPGSDRVELSAEARERAMRLSTSTPIRAGLVQRVSEDIAGERYLTDERLDAAIDALLRSGDLDALR